MYTKSAYYVYSSFIFSQNIWMLYFHSIFINVVHPQIVKLETKRNKGSYRE